MNAYSVCTWDAMIFTYCFFVSTCESYIEDIDHKVASHTILILVVRRINPATRHAQVLFDLFTMISHRKPP